MCACVGLLCAASLSSKLVLVQKTKELESKS